MENVVEPIDPDGNESSDTDEPPSGEVSRAEVGETLTADADGEGPTRPASAQDSHGVTLAIRRVEDEAVTGSSSDSSAPEGTEETTDGSVRADGGETDDLPVVIGHIGRLVDLPIRMLGFLGYLTVEPPMALYRALRPHGRDDENESRPQSDGRSEREP